ncbi:MAG: hypothetical protein M5U01_33805 [Ardenticatenaceae bacterium]|nr:hypothetical protein [Ardenticatenaceae bacterium]HBY98349.1 hypothetical protein [Chloroflexota bacterium]
MRHFYVRRKDLSAFPFQFYVDRDGVQRRLEKGQTFTFFIHPPKDRIEFLHVHILQDFAREAEERWNIPENELIRMAAKGFEAWLVGEVIPEDHFNGIDMLKIDRAWYPQDANGEPRLALNPYDFEVVTDEPWPTDAMWSLDSPSEESASAGSERPPVR